MTKKTKDLTVFIERNSLTFAGGLLERPQKLTFDEKIILDLEIVDKKVFSEKIITIITKTETDTDLILVFSNDSIFFKDIPITSPATEIEKLENNFLSLVPFDRVAKKLIKLSDKYRLVAINWDMCSVLTEALGSLGYKLKIVIPAFIVSSFDQKAGLSDSVASLIVSKQEGYKTLSLVENNNKNQQIALKSVVTSQKSKLPLLVGVFIFLLAFLAFMVIRQ